MSKEEDLQLLKNLNDKMESTQKKVEEVKITNPAQEVENSLVDFVKARLQKIQQDAEFTDLVRMHIRQRLPEASFSELMQLLNETSMTNNQSTADMMKLFRNETSGKTLVDNLKNSSVESTATQLYNSTNDKNVLQAVNYLSQLVSKISAQDAKVVENK